MHTVLTNDMLATLNQIVEAARTKGIATVPVRVSVLAALLDRQGEEAEEAEEAAEIVLVSLRDSAEILFHLGTAGKNPSQDEAVEAVRERVLAAIAKATGAQS